MRAWRGVLLGSATFGEGEEYLQFKYIFALAMLWLTLPLLLLFIAGDVSGANRVGLHGHTIRAYFLMCCALILAIRNRPDRLAPAMWVFALASLGVHISGFLFVPEDESRLVWFYSLIAGTYILLGRRAGAVVAVASIAAVAVANGQLAAPVSDRGMVTFYASLVSLSVIFHVFTSRSVSFHQAMVNSQARLRHLSDHDPLTGVLNARSFSRQCEHLMQLARREGGTFALLFIDLDHFKSVNDEHGHDAGDQVLRAVAGALLHRLRRTDLLGRVGGEEFVVFLPGADVTNALKVAEALRLDIQALRIRTVAGVSLVITASVGVAADTGDGRPLSELQRQADQAMYQAKAGGRNRVSSLALPGQETAATASRRT